MLVSWSTNQITMARPTNTESRKEEIAKGLMRVMAKKGYDGASVAEIAKSAQLTPGLVHYHFKSKLEILVAAIHLLASDHQARLELFLRNAESSREKVEAFIDFHLGVGSTANSEALACWLVMSGEALREPKVKVVFQNALTNLAKTLEECINTGVIAREFKCAEPKRAAAAIVSTIQGYFVIAATAREIIPKGSAAAATKAMASGLIQFKEER